MISTHHQKATENLVIISGPSGVGKGTVISRLLQAYPHVKLAISATTRKPREGEVDGLHYFFLTEEQFDQEILNNGFLEWCQVHANRYGTLKSEVDAMLSKGNVVILEIDVQGAKKVKALCPQAKMIFILPPSIEVLKDRLLTRKTESESVIAKRLQVAQDELKSAPEYDHQLVNLKIDDTVYTLAKTIGLTERENLNDTCL
jgi:guanylate kinase